MDFKHLSASDLLCDYRVCACSTAEIFQKKILPAIPENAGVPWWIGCGLMSIATFILGFMAIKSLSRFQED